MYFYYSLARKHHPTLPQTPKWINKRVLYKFYCQQCNCTTTCWTFFNIENVPFQCQNCTNNIIKLNPSYLSLFTFSVLLVKQMTPGNQSCDVTLVALWYDTAFRVRCLIKFYVLHYLSTVECLLFYQCLSSYL